MHITIQEKKQSDLLNRLEVKGLLQFEGVTPGNAQLTEALAKELKSTPELVVVKHIYTQFGQQKAEFQALVYAQTEAKKKAEVLPSHQKKKLKEEKKAAASGKKSE